MEPRDLNRMFDALAPTREQEQAGLDRLLQMERKVKPMKKLKKLTVIGLAAALMVISCAAAVVTGIDQRLLDYFGAGPNQAELLAPGAVPVDVTVEDNGATLHVTQVLMDRYTIMLLADFTAPEGTVLDLGREADDIFCDFNAGSLGASVPDLLDQTGEPIPGVGGWGWRIVVLDDEDPLDHHLSLLFRLELENGIQPDWEIGGISLHNSDLVRYNPEPTVTTIYSGNWSCEVPVTWQDMGRSIQPNQIVGQLDGINITMTELYLSPMTLRIQMESEAPIPQQYGGGIGNRWHQLANSDTMTLTTRKGEVIPLTDLGGSLGDQDQNRGFRLEEITALEGLEGGTLNVSIEGGSVDIPLEGLVSAEP